MTTTITILQFISCLLIVACVLLQPSKGEATALGASSQSVFGSSGGTTFLFRATMWLAAFLMASSLFLSWYRTRENRESVIDSSSLVVPPVENSAPLAPPPPSTNDPGSSAVPPAGSSK